jgi:hypothetical protein
MKYELELSGSVAANIAALSFELLTCVSHHFDLLCEDPLVLGKRATFPYLPVGQIYECWCEESDGTPVFVTVFFHFKPGEQVLRVHAITRRS